MGAFFLRTGHCRRPPLTVRHQHPSVRLPISLGVLTVPSTAPFTSIRQRIVWWQKWILITRGFKPLRLTCFLTIKVPVIRATWQPIENPLSQLWRARLCIRSFSTTPTPSWIIPTGRWGATPPSRFTSVAMGKRGSLWSM